MNIDELNAKFDEIYAKNKDIQQLFTELEDHNEVLFYLYDTEIKRPNAVLNTMIDNYESLIFKIRESHKDIKDSLAEFGNEKELAQGVNDNEALTDKVKDLILWKLRRLFMVYDEEPILPYVMGDFLNTDLIGNVPPVAVPPTPPEDISEPDEEEEQVEEQAQDQVEDPVENEVNDEVEAIDVVPAEAAEPMVSIEADVPIEDSLDNEEEDYDRFSDPEALDPAGDVFPELAEETT